MRDPELIELTDGQTLLIIVKDGRVIEYTWDVGLPHVEFVKRRVGDLPAGAWVGTVSKGPRSLGFEVFHPSHSIEIARNQPS